MIPAEARGYYDQKDAKLFGSLASDVGTRQSPSPASPLDVYPEGFVTFTAVVMLGFPAIFKGC